MCTILHRGVDHSTKGCGPYYTGVWTILHRGVDHSTKGCGLLTQGYGPHDPYSVQGLLHGSDNNYTYGCYHTTTPTCHLAYYYPYSSPTCSSKGRVGVVVGKGRSWCNSRQGGWLASQTQQQQGVVYAV